MKNAFSRGVSHSYRLSPAQAQQVAVGWLPTPQQPRDVNPVYQGYDQSGYATTQDAEIKARLIDLISAVRTLMRSTSPQFLSLERLNESKPTVPLIVINIIFIVYELLLGG